MKKEKRCESGREATEIDAQRERRMGCYTRYGAVRTRKTVGREAKIRIKSAK